MVLGQDVDVESFTPGAQQWLVDLAEPEQGELPTGVLSEAQVALASRGDAQRGEPAPRGCVPSLAAFGSAVQAGWTDPADDGDQIAWVRAVRDAMAPHASGGVYLSHPDVDDADRVTTADGAHQRRLARIKLDGDPDNIFRADHNIPPRDREAG